MSAPARVRDFSQLTATESLRVQMRDAHTERVRRRARLDGMRSLFDRRDRPTARQRERIDYARHRYEESRERHETAQAAYYRATE